MKKAICSILLLSLLLPFAGCNTAVSDTTAVETDSPQTTDTPQTSQTVWNTESELDVSHILSSSESQTPEQAVVKFSKDNPVFALKEADVSDNTVTLKNSTVSAINIGQKYSDNTTAYYECKVDSKSTDKASWCTLYFGFRLGSAASDPTTQSGIWIAVRNGEIGIRTNTWPETTYMNIRAEGVNFATARMIYFEDDMVNDVITVYADNDAGEKTKIAIVRTEGGNINMYTLDNDRAVITDKIIDSIAENGYANIWLHHSNKPTTVSELKISGYPNGTVKPQEANMMNSKDVFSDTWVCVDDEGRATLSTGKTVNDNKVGIFYFLWHDGTSTNPIYDHSASYYSGGVEALKETMKSGPLGFAHYWAEPYFGYYRSDDEWVIRKHAQQLTEAGVDFIFIDNTNGVTYERNCEAVLRVFTKMRAEGYNTPQVMFHCGNDKNISKASFTALWNNIYSTGRYEDLWFKWEGKPLILAPKTMYSKLPDEMKNFFTFRQSWAYTKGDAGSWYTGPKGKTCWPWADMYPQSEGKSLTGETEQMIVMCGFWVNGSYGTNAGRSYHNGKQPDNLTDNDFGFSLVESSSGKGYAFEEQFDRAIETDPSVVMITGWNEWWAGRWEGSAAIGQTIANTYTVTANDPFSKNYFVDCFNPEYSRDIEPVKGLFNDNYYYQMAQNIRDYKGSRAYQTAFGQRSIDIDGSVGQWYAVGPEYRDYEGDTAHRDSMSYVGQLHYTNDSGRNDFVTAKVSSDGENLYFYAECAENITSSEGTNWMNLFIDADNNAETGWYGYDFVINRIQNGASCSVEKFVNNAWETENAGSAEFRVNGKYIQIKVSAALLGVKETFDFKWADNSVDTGDIMQFLDKGDCAPDARYNYRYTTVKTEASVPSCLKEDMIVLKAGSYNAYANGKTIMLDSTNTNAVFLGEGEKLYVPCAFARDIIGLDIAGLTVLNHYGTSYVEISQALAASGKTLTKSENIVVIGAEATPEELLTLYRNLY